MLGDAYFQLRAQIGTGLFSLLRLAAEADAQESTQAALRGLQSRLRESFLIAALGPDGSGKSTLLNTLFEREFCGAVEPATAGRIAVFQHADEAGDTVLSPETIECRRPHIFLRDFSVVEAPGSAAAATLAPLLARADLILYVVSATAGPPDAWTFLSRLGRDLLRRLIFVVWQSDRVSAEECAIAVKRLRQAMLKNLGQACPIFVGSAVDPAAREKLERWIESEVIFAEPRRVRLRDIGDVARAALREIVARPRTEGQAVEREMGKVHRLREDLAEREEQSKRQVAGALWALAQSFDGLRGHGEELLRARLEPLDLLWKRSVPMEDFALEIETMARASFTVQLHDQLTALEAALQQSADEHLHEHRESASGAVPSHPPAFPHARLEEELAALETPLDLSRVVAGAFSNAADLLRLPALAAVGTVAVALGAVLAGHSSVFLAALAGAVVVFVLLLAFLLRQNVIAHFGRHFTANRAALLTALEPPLHSAAEGFYMALSPALEARAGQLVGERQQHEPLLARLRQIEETFSHIEAALRTGLARSEAGGES